MDDFLGDNFGMSDDEAKTFTGGNNSSSGNSYGNNNNSSSGGGDWKSKGREEWKKKQQEVQEPYMPVVVYIDRDFPSDVKEKLVNLISRLISLGFTVRFNAEDEEIVKKVKAFSSNKIEDHIPFNGFNDMKSKFCWNSNTTNHIAQQNFGAWAKLPKLVQILMSRNVRMLIGSNNNSPAKFLITWSKDGAFRGPQVSNETGNVGTYIKVAEKLAVPVFNLNNQQSRDEMNRFIFRKSEQE